MDKFNIAQKPRYRLLRDAAVNGLPYLKGSEVETLAWPNGHTLEPVNEAARRVASYYRKFRLYPDLPPRGPYNELVGGIYLAATWPNNSPPIPHTDHSGRLANPIPAAELKRTCPAI